MSFVLPLFRKITIYITAAMNEFKNISPFSLLTHILLSNCKLCCPFLGLCHVRPISLNLYDISLTKFSLKHILSKPLLRLRASIKPRSLNKGFERMCFKLNFVKEISYRLFARSLYLGYERMCFILHKVIQCSSESLLSISAP